MPVPNFQKFMLPFLTVLKDGQEHKLRELKTLLASHFQLTDEELNELLPSGRQTKFDNRIGWARTYLKMAGLIEYVAQATFRITKQGQAFLQTNPSEINVKLLKQNPDFNNFVKQTEKIDEIEDEPQQTPEEILETSYQKLRSGLAEEILDTIKTCSPRFFEKLVVDLLVAMGYGGSRKDAGQAVGQSGDGGVDGIIKEDKLGLDVVYIQAKRWQDNIGRPLVQSFAGSLEGFKARKGVFITTSHFTKDAIDYVKMIEKKIVLIDGEQLAQLMIEHGVGVNEVTTYTIKRIDMDYFSEG